MTKNQIIKSIVQTYSGKKVLFKDYDVSFTHNNKDYYVKILPATNNTIVTVNSKLVWELKKGKLNGPRFKTSSKHLYDIRNFVKLDNKIIVFNAKPYKIFKALNESDLADISHDNIVHNIHYFTNPNDIKSILN